MFHEATDQLFLSVGLNTAVSPNVPSTGAGTIETPGDRDIYTFSTATANQQVYIDRQDGSGVSCGSPDVWFTLVDPNALTVLPNFLSNGCQIDPGPRTLVTAGTYTLTVWANSDESGNYRFAVYEATDDTIPIDIGDIVSPGAPSAGAGSIETPGDRDLYTFPGSEGQRVYIDRQEGSGASCSPDFRYSLAGPTTTVFSNFLSLACSIDPGLRTLPEDGTYTLTVWGDGDEYGAHRFWLAGEVSDEGTLRYADQADGTLAVGDVYRYTFEGRDGDIAAAIMYRTGASEPDPHIQFRRPDGSDPPACQGGTTSGAEIEVSCTLDVDGTWSVLVSDNDMLHGGAYQVYLKRTGRSEAPGEFAILSGTEGTITSLYCYDDVDNWFPCTGTLGRHLGTNGEGWAPIDIGTSSDFERVWTQVDYLPEDVSGGYIRAYRVAGGCDLANDDPSTDDDAFSGRRIRVEIQYYEVIDVPPHEMVFRGSHEMIYLHLADDQNHPLDAHVAGDEVSAEWLKWNNASATIPLWAQEDVLLNNLGNGGLPLGYVAKPGTLASSTCTTGAHLHQEADQYGDYKYSLSDGASALRRFTNLHYVVLEDIDGTH